MLPPGELCGEVPTGVMRGYLRVPRGPRHCPCSGIRRDASSEPRLTVCIPPKWGHFPMALPAPCPPSLSHPQSLSQPPCTSGAPPTQEVCFIRGQTDRLKALGPPSWAGVRQSLIQSCFHLFFNVRLSAYHVPVPELGTWGFSEFTSSPHCSVPNSGHLYLGWRLWALRGGFSSLCMLTRGGGARDTCAQKTVSHLSLATELQCVLGGPGRKGLCFFGRMESWQGHARQPGSLLLSASELVLLPASKPNNPRGCLICLSLG